ncbi:hypothetical protein F3Y22_tig00110963pilonHSYRG00145 [Hibiscus syriacus]|uniref:RNase H type-1 domain-containing protein n=1 Tax=Hibiscus syriacus TaxID=106335 RepID=A0A6A2ZB12_HIBSY|nr:hypothetical protein F3Y22_tig00110963pilonHSYRG00145 [Hibiscus syriacus]
MQTLTIGNVGLVKWNKLAVGWIKLNTDGAGIQETILLHVAGFFETAIVRGIRNVEVEVDNTQAFRLLNLSTTVNGTLPILTHIHTLVQMSWSVRFSHISRKSNRVVDFLQQHNAMLPGDSD